MCYSPLMEKRKHSEETRKKMSESRKQYYRDHPEARTRLSESWKQRPREGIAVACELCGTEFYKYPSQTRRFCSHACSLRSRTGPKSPAWKGGRIVTQAGYVMILQPYKGHTRYKFEHRIVLEEKIGRPMEDHETVHHINGIRDDNRPENLELRSGRHGKGASQHCPTCTCHLTYASA